ncbi:hypothetical protein [Burkholderia alba]|uniref:hypothetical protein n=1 Tax=Burkholderia alba TaxID=2683677 RepID=UPI002B0603E6|nr:hypothetical protein [Burkholderia alba]
MRAANGGHAALSANAFEGDGEGLVGEIQAEGGEFFNDGGIADAGADGIFDVFEEIAKLGGFGAIRGGSERGKVVGGLTGIRKKSAAYLTKILI